MTYYLDTSAFLKLVFAEPESKALRAWAGTGMGEFASSDLLRTEALRAARKDSPEALLDVRAALEAIDLVSVTSDICERAAELDPSIMRSLDALHLATALALGDDLRAVVTYDERLAAACALHGVRVVAPA